MEERRSPSALKPRGRWLFLSTLGPLGLGFLVFGWQWGSPSGWLGLGLNLGLMAVIAIAYQTGKRQGAGSGHSDTESIRFDCERLNRNGIAWWRYHPASRKFTCSPGFAKLIGDSEALLSDTELLQRVHDDDRDSVRALAQRAVNGSCDAFYSHHRLRHRTGATRRVAAIGRVRGKGESLNLSGLALPYSEDNSDNSTRTQGFVDHPAIGIWKNVFTNPQQHGFSRRIFSMIGCNPLPPGETMEFLFERMHPDDMAVFRRAVDPVLAPFGQSHYRCVFRLRHHDGHWVRILSLGHCITRTGDGLCDQLSGLHIDLSSMDEALHPGG